MRTIPICALLLTLALAAGCRHDTIRDTAASTDLADQLADVTLDADQLVEAIAELELAAAPAPAPAKTLDITFSRSRSCPAGGTVEVVASLQRSWDPQTLEMEARFDGSRSLTACTFVRGEFTITVDGASTWQAFRRRVAGVPDGPQTSHYSGQYTAVRSDGERRSCSYDVTIVRDPQARTRELDGSFCGRRMTRSIAWSPAG